MSKIPTPIPYAPSKPAPVETVEVPADVANHPMFKHFVAAVEQAMFGKGGRHGGNVTPFLEQPWRHYAKLHGRGFLTGQAAKKLEESANLRSGQPFLDELYGSMVYSAMAAIYESEQMAAAPTGK